MCVYRATPDIRTQFGKVEFVALEVVPPWVMTKLLNPATRTQRHSFRLWILEPTRHLSQLMWTQDCQS